MNLPKKIIISTLILIPLFIFSFHPSFGMPVISMEECVEKIGLSQEKCEELIKKIENSEKPDKEIIGEDTNTTDTNTTDIETSANANQSDLNSTSQTENNESENQNTQDTNEEIKKEPERPKSDLEKDPMPIETRIAQAQLLQSKKMHQIKKVTQKIESIIGALESRAINTEQIRIDLSSLNAYSKEINNAYAVYIAELGLFKRGMNQDSYLAVKERYPLLIKQKIQAMYDFYHNSLRNNIYNALVQK